VCNGCGYCVPSCPFGVINRDPYDGRAAKCTLCYDRMEDGLEPACAKSCPTDAIQFGEWDELVERAAGAGHVLVGHGDRAGRAAGRAGGSLGRRAPAGRHGGHAHPRARRAGHAQRRAGRARGCAGDARPAAADERCGGQAAARHPGRLSSAPTRPRRARPAWAGGGVRIRPWLRPFSSPCSSSSLWPPECSASSPPAA